MHSAWKKTSDELKFANVIITNDTEIEMGFYKDCHLERKIWVYNILTKHYKPSTRMRVLHEWGFCNMGTCRYAQEILTELVFT